ncbi:MAG: sulfatase, partial [Phycisphaerae bacterium]|nr:sulfatase [Phycisphaerae bacterium]
NAHCAAPACNPSRAALMTGIRPWTSGVYHNPQPWRQSPVLKNAITLPQHFRAHGYRAIGSGKIYHGAYPDPASWDAYAPALNRQNFSAGFKMPRNVNGLKKSHFDWGPVDVPDAQMPDAKTADWVIKQLGRSHDRPLFLACGLYRPHLPWYVPKRHFASHPLGKVRLPQVRADDLADVPPPGRKMARPDGDHAAVVEAKQWPQAVRGYLASIAFVDEQIGRVLDALDRGPKAKNTILVFWTDHGWHLGEKQHWRKFALWERATRTPMVIVAPGVTSPGGRCERPVNLIDLYPTLVDLCGLPARKELEGVSLRPLLQDPATAWDRPSVTTHGRGNHAVRSQHFRYIRYADGSEELYDHRTDPNEWTNRAAEADLAPVCQRLARWLPKKEAADAPYDRGKSKRGGIGKRSSRRVGANK